MVAAVLVQLERHDGHPGQERGALLRHPAPQHQPTDPCTTLRRGISLIARLKHVRLQSPPAGPPRLSADALDAAKSRSDTRETLYGTDAGYKRRAACTTG